MGSGSGFLIKIAGNLRNDQLFGKSDQFHSETAQLSLQSDQLF